MAAVKVSSALCLTLLLMVLLVTPIFGRKEACDERLSDTYHMLLLCSSRICNEHFIGEGATRGKCGLPIIRSFRFCTKECD
ncbi:hypothetical protein GQ55_2G209100 [Panicum hallii var. hallii]|uniref:Knottin scorpion toxin-like domain-containing protein n=1 Tax=Panicum hallii var. hallii TaxID=1504633 RepID=A0A2T7EQW4_9POAL|nr:hypothetical protein GQ55_2G209100 [Panicum hallii var. hallii]